MKIERELTSIGSPTLLLGIDWPDEEPRNRQYFVDRKEVPADLFRDVMALLALAVGR